MYSRSYYPEDTHPPLPDGYDGVAFSERADDMLNDNQPQVEQNEAVPTSGSLSLMSGLFGKGGLFGIEGIKMPKIGTEEILIIATAAFLLFSKNGDRECALILLFLLFIN
jgi:hypothetical protein